MSISGTDRALIEATQEGLPFVPQPYAAIAEGLGISEGEVIARLDRLMAEGLVRRIGIAPNHYKLGMVANGMSVWDVDDARAEELGQIVGALEGVTHSYLRPRALPLWPYNLFAMLHGRDRNEVEAQRVHVAEILGEACRGSDILYSTAILKKTGLRLKKGAA